jgi:hypothetical protein
MSAGPSDAPSEFVAFVKSGPQAWSYGLGVFFLGKPRIIQCIQEIRPESEYCKAEDIYTGYKFMAGKGSMIPWDSELDRCYPPKKK